MTPPSAWTPDSALVAEVRPSPNHNERIGEGKPDSVILHYTGMSDGPSAVVRLCDAASEVSCHYVVEEDGSILQLVPEGRRAWCAGRSIWAGETDLNSASVNIEIVNGGHDFGLPAYAERQLAAVVALCRDLLRRHGIAPHRVLGHSDVAPARKRDPGEHFPWNRLADAGIGFWVPPSDDLTEGRPLAKEALASVQADLSRFGYGIVPTGIDDAASRIVVGAFQRHFRPARIDGQVDPGTRDTLARLMRARFPVNADRGSAPRHA